MELDRQKNVSEVAVQNQVSSQSNTCSRRSSLAALCSRSSVSHTMAYLHFVTYTHTHARTHMQAHTHTLLHTRQYIMTGDNVSFHKAYGISPQEKLPDSHWGAQKQLSKNGLIFFTLHVDHTLERLWPISALCCTGLAEWMCRLHSAGDLTAISLRCGSFVSSKVFKLYKTYFWTIWAAWITVKRKNLNACKWSC